MPEATEIAGGGAHIHPTTWVDIAARETGLQAHEDENGTARRSGQPELVNRD